MRCNECEDKKNFTPPVIEITNPEQLILFRKVVIHVSMGTEEQVPPTIGKYRNVLLHYDANNHNYLYSSDGIPTLLEAAVPQEILDRLDSVEAAIETEEAERIAGDEILDGAIASETEARESADSALSSRIDSLSSSLSAEATARANGDAALNTAITSEVTARQNADANLQQQIDGITASSDVKDVVGTKAELNSYDTSTLGDNDIIKVLQDESEDDATTYYRWNATTQQFTLIGEEGPYYTKSQADTLLNAKQNTLTAGSNVQIVGDTISATDTTYTAGTGIDITNNVISATSTGPTVVQTTGTSTTDVMSQNAVTSMVFADPSTNYAVRIGNSSNNQTTYGVAIGHAAMVTLQGVNGVAIGHDAKSQGNGQISIGSGSGSGANAGGISIGESSKAFGRGSVAIGLASGDTNLAQGQFDIGSRNTSYGYNNSRYRLLTGLYDPQSDHDAATKGYVDMATASVPDEFTSTEWNNLWT